MILQARNLKLQELADGVITPSGLFYPYQVRAVNASAPSIFPRAASSRFYVRSAVILVRTVAGDTTTYAAVTATIDGVPNQLMSVVVVPSTAQVLNLEYNPRVLLDAGTSLDWGADVAPTSGAAKFVLAEVDDL